FRSRRAGRVHDRARPHLERITADHVPRPYPHDPTRRPPPRLHLAVSGHDGPGRGRGPEDLEHEPFRAVRLSIVEERAAGERTVLELRCQGERLCPREQPAPRQLTVWKLSRVPIERQRVVQTESDPQGRPTLYAPAVRRE